MTPGFEPTNTRLMSGSLSARPQSHSSDSVVFFSVLLTVFFMSILSMLFYEASIFHTNFKAFSPDD